MVSHPCRWYRVFRSCPYGAGKTLIAIVAAATNSGHAIVLCPRAAAVDQWRTQFLKWTFVSVEQIATAQWLKGTLLTTFNMVATIGTGQLENSSCFDIKTYPMSST